MRGINVVLSCVAAALCLLVGALLHSWLLLGLSLVIAVSVFVLNKKLEQRRVTQLYQASRQPLPSSREVHEEGRAPDFSN